MNAPTIVGYCRSCNRPLISGHTPAGQTSTRYARHSGKGLCDACAKRARRANKKAAQIAAARLTAPAPDWAASAACAGTDPEMWYGDHGTYPDTLNRICHACPVRDACLTTSLIEEADASTHNRFGYRAGTTPAERAQLWKERGAVA